MATDAFEAIAEDFDFLDEWEDRYRYVIDLGRGMEPIEEGLRTDWSRVEGCASQVWIVPEIGWDTGIPAFNFRGDSDALIVRGLIAILRSLYNGLNVSEVLEVDARLEIGRLGLDSHLSSQRSNGLVSMIGRIRELAKGALVERRELTPAGTLENAGG